MLEVLQSQTLLWPTVICHLILIIVQRPGYFLKYDMVTLMSPFFEEPSFVAIHDINKFQCSMTLQFGLETKATYLPLCVCHTLKGHRECFYFSVNWDNFVTNCFLQSKIWKPEKRENLNRKTWRINKHVIYIN